MGSVLLDSRCSTDQINHFVKESNGNADFWRADIRTISIAVWPSEQSCAIRPTLKINRWLCIENTASEWLGHRHRKASVLATSRQGSVICLLRCRVRNEEECFRKLRLSGRT